MTKLAVCLMLSFASFSAGCQTPAVSVCDGIERLTPSSETRQFILDKDRPFAVQVGSHNAFGQRLACWK